MDIRFGTLVRVTPTHARVQNGETAFGRFMPLTGREVTWDRWWRSRLLDGDIRIVPAVKPESQPVTTAKDEP